MVGFELETNCFQFYAIANLDKTSLYLTIHLGNLLRVSVFIAKPQRELLSIILNCPFWYRAKCLFQIKVQLSTCQLKIWEKGKHDHSKDTSKTIPVAEAEKIKETVKLAPVGHFASKLSKELNQLSATLVSPTK